MVQKRCESVWMGRRAKRRNRFLWFKIQDHFHSGLWTDSDEDSGPDRIKSSHPVYLQRDTHFEIQISSFSWRPPKASYLALSADQSEKAFQHWTLHIILHSDAQRFKCGAEKNNKLFDFRGSSVNSETFTLFDIRGSYVIVQTNKSDILFQCMYLYMWRG